MRYTFPCGCSFKVAEESPPDGVLPYLEFDPDAVPEDCPAVWELLAKGLTKTIFQLESPLGRQWCRRIKPESLEHMGALGALLRPGALQAKDAEGVSTTEHYARRKNGLEETKAYHPVVDGILSKTYNLALYQENLMALGQALAGFDLKQIDVLRTSVGKKDQKLLAKVREEFLAGCERTGVAPRQIFEEVWSWIQAAGRYSFCKAHATSYGITGYDTAYRKAHFPLQWFTAKLKNAHHKPDPRQEVRELVEDARLFDVAVLPPDLRSLAVRFHTDRRVVRFGLADVKGVGEAGVGKLTNVVRRAEAELKKGLGQFSWVELLSFVGAAVPANVFSRLVEAGALDWVGLPRRRMWFEYQAYCQLNDGERRWLKADSPPDLLAGLERLGLPRFKRPRRKSDPVPAGPFGGCRTDAREATVRSLARSLRSPPYPLEDAPNWVVDREEMLLGVGVTYHRVDGCDASEVNCSCKEFLAGRAGFLVLCVDVLEVTERKTKAGKTPGAKMASLRVSDTSCAMDAVAFPEAYREFAHLFTRGNTVILQGEVFPNRKREYDSFVIKRAFQAVPKEDT